MSTDAREKLTSEMMTGQWTDIRPHLERNAIFLVANDLNLIDVGISVLNDDVKSVSKWLEQGELARPTEVQIQTWDTLEAKSFRFLILAPYVLIQEVGH